MNTIGSTAQLRFLWLEITRRCNLTCLHCYADSGPDLDLLGSMTRDDWLMVIQDAADQGCRDVQFIGGEPTLHPGLLTLIKTAKEAGFTSVEVFTNATGITESLASAFHDQGVRAACSFYSVDPATHDRITNRSGSFHQTVRGIKRLLAHHIPLRVELVETDENRGHLTEARHFLQGLRVKRGGADRQRGIGRGAKLGLLRSPMQELCGKCWQGRLCVTATGETYPCVFSRFCPLGDAREGLAPILQGQALSEFRTSLRALHTTTSSCKPDCGPDPCDPTDQCNPDCSPNYGCPPEEGGCNPDEDCRPAQNYTP